MRKPPRGLVLAVAILFVGGCFHVQPQPLPEPQDRYSVDVRGVILESGERIAFQRVDRAEWTDTTLIIGGLLEAGADGGSQASITTTRSVPLSSISEVLVRQVDANRTSIIIGGVIVGVIAAAALLLTGQAEEYSATAAPHRD